MNEESLLLVVLAGIDPGHLINNQVCLVETKLLSSEKQYKFYSFVIILLIFIPA